MRHDTGSEDLARAAQEQNTKLQGLIDAVGILIAGSRSLLIRLDLLEGRGRGKDGGHPSPALPGGETPPDGPQGG